MKVVVQRVNQARVIVDERILGEIKHGYLLLVCMEKGDSAETITKACKKIVGLRIFEDENAKMNKNLEQVGGEILSISQFTLSWDGSKGNRPSFENSMPPEQARLLYSMFNKQLRDHGINVATGKFAASMQVELTNNGPVTFSLEF
jgi:D-aminoacyl-tRNA deacylase